MASDPQTRTPAPGEPMRVLVLGLLVFAACTKTGVDVTVAEVKTPLHVVVRRFSYRGLCSASDLQCHWRERSTRDCSFVEVGANADGPGPIDDR